MSNGNKTIVLIFPEVSSNVTLKVLPFGLLAIASSLRKAGLNTVIADLNVTDEKYALDIIRKNDPLFIGLSVFTGPMIQSALAFSQKIRAFNRKVPLVWGGPHPTIMPDITIAHPLVDIICAGEGEKCSVELANALVKKTGLHGINGLIFKDENGSVIKNQPVIPLIPKNADSQVSLDLDSIDLSPYIFQNHGKKTAIFLSSRGCPYRCSFCWNVLFHKRRFTPWSPKKVMEEIEPLLKHGVEKVLLLDSFLGPVSRVITIGKLMKERGIAWDIEDGCRVDYHCTDEFFKGLKENGCSHVAFGAESGSQEILNIICKDITTEDILKSAYLSNTWGIGSRYQWMVGIPGESKQDCLKTLDLIDAITKINPRSAHSLELYLPYPGNALYNMACESGWHAPEDLVSWGNFRWEGRYPYHREGTWYYKCIQYCSFFHQQKKLEALLSYTGNIKTIYKIMSVFLRPLATLRWKLRFFRFPVEYQIAEFFRRKLEKKVSYDK